MGDDSTVRGEGAGRPLAAQESTTLPSSDPAASASLDELVLMNIAGDIEAVADELDAVEERTPLPGLLNASNRLRRIAAGIRDRGATEPQPLTEENQ